MRTTLLAMVLPKAVKRAVEAYGKICEVPPPDDPKEFTALQGACKAAIGHLTALFQLHRLVTATLPKAGPDDGAPDNGIPDDPFAEVYARAARTIAELDGTDAPDGD
ncbi:hypothetical protein [Skermanella pratensis]|uniref:hypothetical protein n=1 Tax=Skermanella pratensis TaxID=2233999 RepID=UPI00178817D8|nr:hypothetical protein [Skermanella pratensis]